MPNPVKIGRSTERGRRFITSSEKDLEERIAKVIADQLPELSAQNQRLAHPVCPVCDVLIDKARAEGCGITLQDYDLQAIQTKVREQKEAREAAVTKAALQAAH